MNANRHVKVFFRRFQLHSHRVALRHFASIRSGHMKPNNSLLVKLITYELSVADVVRLVRHRPFQRPKVCVIHLGENFVFVN